MNNIIYIGCDDTQIDLFESQYIVPQGMCYNSYLVISDKIAVMDTVDSRFTNEWLEKLSTALNGRQPHYLVVQHLEPDHSGSVAAFLQLYPETTIVASNKALQMMPQFGIQPKNTLSVADNNTLDLGLHTLCFITAPMVHWPEVIMTYCPQEKTLFSADAFGKFGVYNADPDDWTCEARRYYFNICGKYGIPVQTVLKKASTLDIQTIAPLHGPVLTGQALQHALHLYTIWSNYEAETDGILVAYASIHGNTKKAAETLADMLRQNGIEKIALTDLCRDDMAEAIEDAFRMSRMIVCASSYDANVFPPMHLFLWELQMKGYQNRKVGIVENGSWAPTAGRIMRSMLETMKNITIVEPTVTIHSTMNDDSIAQLQTLASAIL